MYVYICQISLESNLKITLFKNISSNTESWPKLEPIHGALTWLKRREMTLTELD